MAGRGGTRAGAGRPRVGQKPITVPAVVDEGLAAVAERLGKGNRSEGVRKALKIAEENEVEEKEVPVFKMPEKYKNNWHIYLALSSDAQVAYARAVADRAVPNGARSVDRDEQSRWYRTFDAACIDWHRVNPIDPMWSAGLWPEGAAEYLGNGALEEARSLAAEMRASVQVCE